MRDVRYDIGAIFQAAFGINSPVYMVKPIRLGTDSTAAVYTGVHTIQEDEAESMSWLGTPIVFPITLQAGGYKIYDAVGRLKEQRFEDFVLPSATLVEFSRAKNIATTEVLGSNGTVKEIFGFADWQIRMRGVCLPERNRSEIDQKNNLLKWEQIAGSIKVDGALFFEKGIDRMVITDLNFAQIQGKPNVIPFELTAISDQAIELVMNQENEAKLGYEELELLNFYE